MSGADQGREASTAALAAAVGGLREGPRTPPGALAEAHRLVADALAAGHALDDIRPAALAAHVAGPADDAIDAAAAAAAAASPSEDAALVRLTAHPAGLGFGDRRLRASAATRLGPFLTGDGLLVDLIVLTRTVATPVVQGGRTIAVVPLPGLRRIRPASRFDLRAGSAWVAAGVLTGRASTPAGFCGLRIAGGRIVTDAPATFAGGALVLADTTQFTLELTLDPPAVAPPTSSIGADGARADVGYPEVLTLRLGGAAPEAGGFTSLDATVWGGTVELALAGGTTVRPVWDADEQAVVVPLAPAATTVPVTSSNGSAVIFAGEARITDVGPAGKRRVSAGWAFPLNRAAPGALGAARGAGAAMVRVGTGLAFTSDGRPWPLADATVTVEPGFLSVLGRRLEDTAIRYPAWSTDAGDSFLALRLPADAPVLVQEEDGTEAVFAEGAVDSRLAVPVDVTGGRIPARAGDALVAWVTTDTGTVFLALGAVTDRRPVVLALHNALLETTGPRRLTVSGDLVAGALVEGTATLALGLAGLSLALPDPYATTQTPQRQGERADGPSLLASVTWAPAHRPAVDVRLAGDVQAPHFERLPAIGTAAASRAGAFRRGGRLALLDVSGAADIFGVDLLGPQLRLRGMAVEGNMRAMALLAPPAVSWEAVDRIDQFGHPTGQATGATDGPPTRLLVNHNRHVAVAPKDLVAAQPKAVAAGAHVFAEFSLPFGMVADVGDGTDTGASVNLSLIRPAFTIGGTQPGGLPVVHRGGHQLRLEPRGTVTDVVGLDGTMTLAPASTGYSPPLFPTEVLTWLTGGTSPVPVQRIDLSGWGESGFSHWLDADDTKVGLVEARVEVLVGRASREILTFASFVWPWGIRVKRTFTFERRADGGITETDSGWQAIDDGLFQASRLKTLRPESGPFSAAQRPTRIVDTPVTVTSGALECAVVTFNGDLRMSPDLVVRAGATRHPGDTATFVPATGLRGLLQVKPYNKTVGSPLPLPPVDLAQLLHDHPLGVTPLTCMVDLGHPGTPGMALRVTGVEVGLSRDKKKLVTTLRGAPVLPRSGAWTVGRRGPAEVAPSTLPHDAPVPLVRARPSDPWALCEPADALNPAATTATAYSLVQGTATQKALFERPTVAVASTLPPGTAAPVAFARSQLAHAGALLGATGPFPSILEGIHTALSTLDVVAGAIATPASVPQPFTITHAPVTLADFTPVHATFELGATGNSTDARLTFDPDGRWEMQLDKVRVCLSIDGMGSDPLLTVVGSAHASSSSAPSLSDIDVVYGGFLQPLQEIFTKLQELASFLPQNSPPGLDVSFADGRLTVRDEFALPTLPLGFGEISDISLDLGATIAILPLSLEFLAGIGSEDRPFHWILSPLSGTGCLEVGVRDGDLIFLIQAGLGLGLAIDVAVASGSASIVLALQVDNKTAAIRITIILTGQASVDVLGGVASASLTLSAGLSIAANAIPPTAITIGGDVGVGIHISICWVIDIDFDGSWHFEQSFSV
jgi:hypothetical protein